MHDEWQSGERHHLSEVAHGPTHGMGPHGTADADGSMSAVTSADQLGMD